MKRALVERTRAGRGPWVQVWSPRGFEWNTVELPVGGLAQALDGLRVLHITDLHFRPRWSGAYDRILQRVADAPPDLVLITGDFVESKVRWQKALPYVERFVTGLKSRLGIYAVLGNHDGHLLGAYVARWNVKLIGNRLVRVAQMAESDGATERRSDEGAERRSDEAKDQASVPANPSSLRGSVAPSLLSSSLIARRSALGTPAIELIGLEGVVRQDLDEDEVARLPLKEPGTLRIVLSHYPDAITRTRGLEADLFLAGHTHGGQICLPGGLPIVTHDSLPRACSQGIHRIGDTWLVSNRGLGFTTLPLRVFCPAEVIEINVIADCPLPIAD